MPTGPALITEAELAAFLEEDEAELPAGAAFLIGLASDAVRDELDQRVDYVEDDVEEVMGEGTDVLLLPELPAIDVTSVAIPPGAGEEELELTVVAGDFRLERGRGGRFGVLRRTDGGFWPRRPLLVTYSHGYKLEDPLADPPVVNEVPGVIRLVVCRVAARMMTNPTGERQESAGRWSATHGAGPEVTDTDRRSLGPFYPGTKAGSR
jgi:hypothetical protein